MLTGFKILLCNLHFSFFCPQKQSLISRFSARNEIPIRYWPVDEVPLDTFDVGVVVSFGHLIPAQAINACKYGILNVHGSLLPRWRGASPIHHAILAGDTKTGVTIMKIVADKFDVGQILATQEYVIPERATTKTIHSDLSVIGANLLMDTLMNLEERLKTAYPQPKEGITKAPKVKKEYGHLDWTRLTAVEVDTRSRALDSLIDVYTEWVDGTQLRLYESCDPKETENMKIDHLLQDTQTEPGSIYFHRRRKVICFKCCDGKWAGFKSMSLKGRKRMSSADFYNGFLRKLLENKNVPLLRPQDFISCNKVDQT